jgi:hypothetical protein
LVPTLANYINGNWENKEILLNNVMTIFILNVIMTPSLKIFDISYYMKIFNRYRIEKTYQNQDPADITLSQQEMNELYENPPFKSDYNFSYVGKTCLITFFFMPIFPCGILISLFGLIYVYFIDKVAY